MMTHHHIKIWFTFKEIQINSDGVGTKNNYSIYILCTLHPRKYLGRIHLPLNSSWTCQMRFSATFFFKIWSWIPFSMYIIMVWRKFAFTASVARTEAKCDFLAKSQILSTDTKPRFADHLSGSKQNQWPYQNRASLLISISTENSKNDRKMTPLPPQMWI